VPTTPETTPMRGLRWTGGLASVWRIALAAWALALGAEALIARISEAWWPSPLPPAEVPAAAAWCGLALALAGGVATRPVTLPMAICVLLAGEPAVAGQGHALLIALLVLAGAMPSAPYGSWPARGRVDPAGGWALPDGLRGLAWLCAAAAWAYGLWRIGAGDDPAASPLAAPRYLGGLLLIHGLTFNPARVAPGGPEIRVVYYDGACGLCHRAVRFLVAEDQLGQLTFAPLGGATFAASVDPGADLPDSVVVQLDDGSLHVEAAAARILLDRLGGGWRLLAAPLHVIPLPVTNLAYTAIARVRRRVFTRPKDQCPLLPPELQRRFLP